MAYDNSSLYGDLICDNYPEDYNMMNPPNDMGWFFYNLEGKSFDFVEELVGQLSLDLSPVRCSDSYLHLYGEDLKLKKDPSWSYDEYRALILVRYYNIMTLRGLENVLNKLYMNVLDDSTGYIKCDYTVVGFRVSDENTLNELISDENTTNDLLTDTVGTIVHINVPTSVDTGIIEFLQDYLPYEVTL